MTEPTVPTLTITWHTQITEEFEAVLSIAAIARELELTEEEVLSYYEAGELTGFFLTDFLADFEDADSGAYISTDDRRVRSISL